MDQAKDLENKIKKLPEGNLIATQSGKYIKYYKSNGKRPIYISKKDRGIAEKLAIKKYYLFQVEEIKQQLRILNKCLTQYDKINTKSMQLLEDSTYTQILSKHFQTFPEKIQQWTAEKYKHNDNHLENLIHKTAAGHYVRSKSEVIIANALYANHIPYRYECGLQLDGVTFYPDFTICHPDTMKEFYWEHFGMMDIPQYCDNAFNKLKVYGNNGIVPSINLVTTFETQIHPINSETVQKIIEEMFL